MKTKSIVPGVRQKDGSDLEIDNRFFYLTLILNVWKAETAGMTTQQTGEYINLLVAAWERSGQLPADMKRLHELSISDRSFEAFTEDCKPIFKNFFQNGGTLEHPSLMAEHSKATQKHAVNVERGRKGGQAKATRNGHEAEDELIPTAQPSAAPPPPVAEPKKEYSPHVQEIQRRAEAAKAGVGRTSSVLD